MAEKITESIFSSSTDIYNDFLTYAPRGPKYFDLHRKHFLYGRVDLAGDAVHTQMSDFGPSGANLEQIYTGKTNTEFAIDFVSEAFDDMRRYIEKMANGNHISRNSVYNRFIKVHKAWRYGDLENSYYKHVNKIYSDFVNNYLSVNARAANIRNFGDFVYSFLGYLEQSAYYFPFTKTGYILSNHCSPFISGLMIEVAGAPHGIENSNNIDTYSKNDPNYNFYVRTARKFGFMVDRNAPWRLVFNLASGADSANGEGALGAKRYMVKYGVQYENIFDLYYEKAHLKELDNIRNYMYSLYTTFYNQFPFSSKPKYTISEHVQGCNKNHLATAYEDRQPPPDINSQFAPNTLGLAPSANAKTSAVVNTMHDEYWIKVLLKLRLTEVGIPHTDKKFNNLTKEMIKLYRLFSMNHVLNKINDFTKGFFKPKFTREGKYWYGDSRYVYEQKKREAKEKMHSPDQANPEITSALNKR